MRPFYALIGGGCQCTDDYPHYTFTTLNPTVTPTLTPMLLRLLSFYSHGHDVPIDSHRNISGLFLLS